MWALLDVLGSTGQGDSEEPQPPTHRGLRLPRFNCSVQLLGPPRSKVVLVRVDLAKETHYPTPYIRIPRQQVDDLGPALAVLIAVAHQHRRDRSRGGDAWIREPRERSCRPYVGFPHTDTCLRLSLVNGSPFHPP
jgi:hypothetical protein